MSGRLYGLEARDKTGVFLGLSLAQCLLVGSGLITTVLLRLVAVPILVAVVPLTIAAALAKLQISGRPLHQWLSLLGSWVVSGMTGRRRWRAALPLLPSADGEAGDLPPVLQGVDIVEVAGSRGDLAVIRDRRSASLTVVVPVEAAQFASADGETQDRLLAGWGNVLAAYAAADTPVTQIGWSHQGTSSTLAEHRSWVDELHSGTESDRTAYRSLVDEVAELAAQHETTVWLTVSGREISGKGKLLDRAAANLPGALETSLTCLGDAGIRPQPVLTVPDLWRLLRRRADPIHATSSSPSVSLADRMGLLSRHNGRPLALDTAWSEVRVDGSWHRIGWVETWPRRAVTADWLSGFLLTEGITMTVVHRPLDPARSQRRVDSQLVKLSAHRARKEDKGRRVTEVDRRTEEAVQDLEGDLVSGHGEMLYLGLVSVCALELEDLDERWHRAEQAARAAQMGLRVLYGRQDVAWAASLPCGLTEPGALELVGL